MVPAYHPYRTATFITAPYCLTCQPSYPNHAPPAFLPYDAAYPLPIVLPHYILHRGLLLIATAVLLLVSWFAVDIYRTLLCGVMDLCSA